jgi:hypothetical protein
MGIAGSTPGMTLSLMSVFKGSVSEAVLRKRPQPLKMGSVALSSLDRMLTMRCVETQDGKADRESPDRSSRVPDLQLVRHNGHGERRLT